MSAAEHNRGRNNFERRVAKAQRECDAWNAAHPVGTAVDVTRDNGSVTQTTTRSIAWVVGDHASCMFVGQTGGYLLSRFKAVDP